MAIHQNFGFNQKYPVASAPAAVLFPDQSLATWTATESAQWLAAGAASCNTSTFAYSGSTVRIGTNYGGGAAKWAGGSLASNGKIYCAPHVRSDWLIVNTNNDTTATTGSVNGNSEGSVYDKITNTVYGFGGSGTKIITSTDVSSNISGPGNRSCNPIQGFNGDYLFTCGFSFTGMRRYQISTNTTTTLATPTRTFGEFGCGGSDGCMYFPNTAGGTNVLKYDPVANTCTNLAIGNAQLYAVMVQHYDGYIYLLPTGGTSTAIRKLEVSTGTISAAHTMASSFGCSNACIGLDGRIYIVSSGSGGIRWFDPTANTSGNITISNSDVSFQGITMGVNGDLYLIPWNANPAYVHKLPLVTGTGTPATDIVSQYNFGGRMCWPG
jgi:hypothetical protein